MATFAAVACWRHRASSRPCSTASRTSRPSVGLCSFHAAQDAEEPRCLCHVAPQCVQSAVGSGAYVRNHCFHSTAGVRTAPLRYRASALLARLRHHCCAGSPAANAGIAHWGLANRQEVAVGGAGVLQTRHLRTHFASCSVFGSFVGLAGLGCHHYAGLHLHASPLRVCQLAPMRFGIAP